MAKQQVNNEVEDQEDEVAGAQFENSEDGLVVNLSEVEELKFELLPKGIYDIVIEDVQYQKSKSSGKPMWNLKLNVVGGEFNGRKIFEIFSFSEGALPGTKTRLAVIAPELLSGDFSVNNPETVASLIGRQAKVKLDIQKAEEGSGYEDQNRVKRWLQPDANKAFV